MSVYECVIQKKAKVAVVGLGYVGMPLAAAFAQVADVIGYDLSEKKIMEYRSGRDYTGEVGDEALQKLSIEFTCDESRLFEAAFVIVAVPTPVNNDESPDLVPLISASEAIGRNLRPGALVVYESTVYPGVTESVCVPAIEKTSGKRCGADFKVGYSPERINPGDKVHKLHNIVKIVSAMDEQSLEDAARLYGLVVQAGVHRCRTIKAAEAAKVAENSQRDINVAFMNELAMAFGRMGVDTHDVIDAMRTKWNALHFSPGLVGGHCISVDPYYFIYEARRQGYRSSLIESGRKINNRMARYVVDRTIQMLIRTDRVIRRARICVMGLTFKEDCPDTRDSRAAEIVQILRSFGVEPIVSDPHADPESARAYYGIDLVPLEELHDLDCLIFAVAHRRYSSLTLAQIDAMFRTNENSEKVIFDVKGQFRHLELQQAGYRYWRL